MAKTAGSSRNRHVITRRTSPIVHGITFIVHVHGTTSIVHVHSTTSTVHVHSTTSTVHRLGCLYRFCRQVHEVLVVEVVDEGVAVLGKGF